MKHYSVTFTGEADKLRFVRECENDFEKRLDVASRCVLESGVSKILLSGPTCAGKTTTANKIIEDFHSVNKNVIIISIDDFFYERKENRQIQEDVKLDYDSVDVLDLPLLSECIKNAKTGNTIRVPIFDFISQSRKGFNEYQIKDNDVLIFEGIQAVYPEVTSLFDDEYIGIFIDVQDDISVNGVEFSKNEMRLVRRIVRDRKFRGASADFSFYLWETVRENEEKSIFPNKDVCKIQIDSFMGYELFLMKKYIKEAISEIKPDNKYYRTGELLLSKFNELDEISYDYIPANSLYTEFLGKK